MVKTIICIRRKPQVSREEFLDFWRNRHGELIKKLKDDLKIVRYVQSHSIDSDVSQGIRSLRGAPEMYDGIAESWFKSMDDLRSLGSDERSRRALAALREDEEDFLDRANSPFWVSEEIEIF